MRAPRERRPATPADFADPTLAGGANALLAARGCGGALDAVVAGHPRLAAYVLRAYHPGVARHSAQYAEAEAAAAVAVWRAALQWRPDSGRSWRTFALAGVRQSVWNCLSPHKRARSVTPTDPEQLDRTHHDPAGSDALDALADLLAALPELERQIIQLRHGLGRAPHTAAEAALALGLTDSAVEQLTAQALDRLRRYALRHPRLTESARRERRAEHAP